MICVLLQFVRIALETDGYETAIILFDRIVSCTNIEELFQNCPIPKKVIISQTFAYRSLTMDHFIALWLVYCYLRYFNMLPTEAFHSFPYEYLVKETYFVICWDIKSQSCPKAVKNFLLRSMTNLLKLYKQPQSLTHSHNALIKNMFEFQKHLLGQYEKSFLEYIEDLSLKFENHPELFLINIQINV